MIYVLAAGASFILIVVVINYMRKLHWDAVHINLLDLVDDIGGQVLRQGFLGQPIFHGQYKKMDITINFSTERHKKKRRNLIDISIGMPIKKSFTISSYEWLKEREDSALDEFKSLDLDGLHNYGLRNPSDNQIAKESKQLKFRQILLDLDPFLFLFVGANGLLYEKDGGNLAVSTKHPALKDQIRYINLLMGVIN